MDLDLACLSFDQIQKIKELKKFESCMEFIPDCDISENEIFVCRSSISSLPKEVWRNIQDPKIGTLAHKNKFVSCYEMVCILLRNQGLSVFLPILRLVKGLY